MRKRVILFCVFVVVVMSGLRYVIERNSDRASRHSYRTVDRSPSPAQDPQPWVEVTPAPMVFEEEGMEMPSVGEYPVENELVTTTQNPIENLLAEETVEAQESEADSPTVEAGASDDAAATGEEVVVESSVVINEIMYHPMHSREVEPTGEEFIELYNPTDKPVVLRGYRFTRGIDFTFDDVTLEAGGYVVIASDLNMFRDTYGEQAHVVGPFSGRLSNSSEEVRLRNAEGKVVDRVEYADQGDWADRMLSRRSAMSHRSSYNGRTRYSSASGWVWACEADGGGSSLELVSSQMSNNHGANWRPSRDRHGTPGAVNSMQARNIAPLISKVRHRPAIPQPNQRVLVLAEIDDENMASVRAEVLWRVSQRRNREPFKAVPMLPIADGRYTAVLPAYPDKTVIEFYVRATDGAKQRQWPSGAEEETRANALYQVDSEKNRTAMAFYRLIMTEDDNRSFGNSNRHSNAMSNTTLIADDGSGPVIRYGCGTRVRGAGSRSNNPPPMRVNIPRDRPWNGATRMNLNSVYPWLQHIGMKIFQASGLPAPNTTAVQARRNGRDYASKRSKDYGAIVHVQPLDGIFLNEHYSEDDRGNLYKKVRPDRDWSWRRGDVSDYQNDGWLKQTNAGQWDWSDLDHFLDVMNNSPDSSNYLEQVESVMNLDQWLRYFAVMALLGNGEGGIANGIDDDYAMYRGVKDTRFQALPHDLDTILAVGEATSNPQHTLFDFAERGDEIEPLEPLFDHPEIRRRYFTVMAELLQTSFSNDDFGRLMDQHLGGWVPASSIRRMKDFMALRASYAAQEVRRGLGKVPTKRRPTSKGAVLSDVGGEVILSEILAENVSVHAHGDAFPDIIELHNPGSATVSLAGMSLTDDAEVPGKFIFPAGAEIDPGAYLVIYADALVAEGEFHTGFALKREGETLTLYGEPNSGGVRPTVDTVTFGPQIADCSISRTRKDKRLWTLTKPSIGKANPNLGLPLGSIQSILINEWLAAPQARFSNDYVELINLDDRPVALGGVAVTSNYVRVPDEHRYPMLSFMGPKQYLLMESLGKAQKRRHPCDLPYRLPSHSGWVRLVGSNGVEIDKVHYTAQRPDVAQGRLPNGSETVVYLTLPTPGAANGAAKNASSAVRALLLGLRVSEIMYHPENPDLEFIELTNIGSLPVNLKGVRFTGGIGYVFSEGTLETGQCLILAGNEAAFTAQVPEGVRIAGQYSGKLSNGGETIELTLPKPANLAIQRFKYNDKWYSATDGNGRSLSVIDVTADVKRWDDLTNWRPSPENGGTPGTL